MEAQREPGHAAHFPTPSTVSPAGKPSGSGVEGVTASLRARDLLRRDSPGYKYQSTPYQRGCQEETVTSHPLHAVPIQATVQAHRAEEDGSHRDPLMPTLRPFRIPRLHSPTRRARPFFTARHRGQCATVSSAQQLDLPVYHGSLPATVTTTRQLDSTAFHGVSTRPTALSPRADRDCQAYGTQDIDPPVYTLGVHRHAVMHSGPARAKSSLAPGGPLAFASQRSDPGYDTPPHFEPETKSSWPRSRSQLALVADAQLDFQFTMPPQLGLPSSACGAPGVSVFLSHRVLIYFFPPGSCGLAQRSCVCQIFIVLPGVK